MPFPVLPPELPTRGLQLIVCFYPLRQGSEFGSGELGKGTEIQAVDGQRDKVDDETDRCTYGNRGRCNKRYEIVKPLHVM